MRFFPISEITIAATPFSVRARVCVCAFVCVCAPKEWENSVWRYPPRGPLPQPADRSPGFDTTVSVRVRSTGPFLASEYLERTPATWSFHKKVRFLKFFVFFGEGLEIFS